MSPNREHIFERPFQKRQHTFDMDFIRVCLRFCTAESVHVRPTWSVYRCNGGLKKATQNPVANLISVPSKTTRTSGLDPSTVTKMF